MDQSQIIQEQIVDAYQSKRPLRIVGGNSKAFMGLDTEATLATLSLAAHRGVIDYQPVELVLTARAGTPLSELSLLLAEHEQMLGFEPPQFGETDTLGGCLATNLSGAGRPWLGSIRDHVLGIRLLNGRGELLRFGGQVMKNVAGYDVSRLQAGALGTLGVIMDISIKVLPKPAHTLTLCQPLALNEAITLMNQRAGKPKPISASCWLDGVLYTRLSGAASAVEATAKQWQGEIMPANESARFWQQLNDQQLAFFAGDTPLWRFSVQSSATMPTALTALTALTEACIIDWGGAQRWYRGDLSFTEMVQFATQMRGEVSLFRGGDRTQQVMHPVSPVVQKLQQNIKQQFDPQGIFNPKRLYYYL